ncbi:MAG: hypothetical protein GF331_13630 [Chitinivibrionales bacterium]|nr:hypothetical protein [Chitinivibrionales bacterium]
MASGILSSVDGSGWESAGAIAYWRDFSSSFIHAGKLWYFGGSSTGTSVRKDAGFKEESDSAWHRVDSTNVGRRYGQSTVSHESVVWLVSGHDEDSLRSDTWYSYDGLNWILATRANPFTARITHGGVYFDNRTWIMGGEDATGVLNDVWYTSDLP